MDTDRNASNLPEECSPTSKNKTPKGIDLELGIYDLKVSYVPHFGYKDQI